MAERTEQVLMLPFLAKGHLLPFSAFALHLEQKTSYGISIITTPLNIPTVRSFLPPNTTVGITSLPFNSSQHGLPCNSENTQDIPAHLILRLILASEALQSSFECLLADICGLHGPPLCIVSDMFMSWSVDSAGKFGVFHSFFDTMGAFGTAVFLSLWTHLPHKQTDADDFPLPDFPHIYLHRSQLGEACKAANGSDPWSVVYLKCFSQWRKSPAILVNTVEELEKRALHQLRMTLRKKVSAIGPILPPPRKQGVLALTCTDWLNLHPPHSVLYVSFGSQNSIHVSQMMEIAKGLEESGMVFLWAVRPPIGFDLHEEFRSEWLPERFEDRVAERNQGILLRGWVPQLEILSHGSTGGFLSHCGWNSVIESLSNGVPIIGWPMSADQFCNSKMVVEDLGAGAELGRGSGAEISGDAVARLVRKVMDGESKEGKEMRKQARKIQQLNSAAKADAGSTKGSSTRALQDFLQRAVDWRDNSNP